MDPAPKKSHTFSVWMLLSGGAIVAALTFTCSAPAQSASSTAPKIKNQPITYVTPVSGEKMYEAYCTSCHGADGRGNATAARALASPPPDLTLLSNRNGGKFPEYRIRDLLTDEDIYRDRAARGMPLWAPAFRSLHKDHPDLVRLRAQNLVAYLKMMQASPVRAGSDRP